ncbi:hypothetical protein ACIP88_12570 [Streptomyces uncialis]|uniref:hypothetical protein n=1 Tax=Streptomyces uncialis TaxID=1048205 RepID=UPI00381E331A
MNSSTPSSDPWTTQVRGETVTLPSTADGIRALLQPERRAEFDAALAELDAASAPQAQRTLQLAWWALATVPGAIQETDAEIARLRAGTTAVSSPWTRTATWSRSTATKPRNRPTCTASPTPDRPKPRSAPRPAPPAPYTDRHRDALHHRPRSLWPGLHRAPAP